eukprot:CAMPEP_0203964132 /NCGR_PEP_ID=MMETSP0359-20131031/93950_1 /ASSEMBLY_ACC=CAM_ASM_000338 /TAXON_ID=268821 /ORGANISM="Scrippsiella Hangoei, Strain SHTV-5" /LENGTH=68 /DNA_ID=CAMNT_0050900387 /DNA_START=19 /DNA_END=225 /DNA_ORIENTATION=-
MPGLVSVRHKTVLLSQWERQPTGPATPKWRTGWRLVYNDARRATSGTGGPPRRFLKQRPAEELQQKKA